MWMNCFPRSGKKSRTNMEMTQIFFTLERISVWWKTGKQRGYDQASRRADTSPIASFLSIVFSIYLFCSFSLSFFLPFFLSFLLSFLLPFSFLSLSLLSLTHSLTLFLALSHFLPFCLSFSYFF